jgi:hypothetical protein
MLMLDLLQLSSDFTSYIDSWVLQATGNLRDWKSARIRRPFDQNAASQTAKRRFETAKARAFLETPARKALRVLRFSSRVLRSPPRGRWRVSVRSATV